MVGPVAFKIPEVSPNWNFYRFNIFVTPHYLDSTASLGKNYIHSQHYSIKDFKSEGGQVGEADGEPDERLVGDGST